MATHRRPGPPIVLACRIIRRAATDELRAWLEHHFPTFDIALDGQLIADSHKVVRRCNAAAATMLCCPYGMLVGRSLGLFFIGPDRRDFYAYLNEVPNGNHHRTVELRLACHPSDRREIEMTARPISYDEGLRPGHYWWLLRDLTAARQSKRETQRDRRMLEYVVDTADVIVLIANSIGRIVRSSTFTSSRVSRLTGYTAAIGAAPCWCPAIARMAGKYLSRH